MASRLVLGYADKVATAVSLTSAAANPAFPAAELATVQPGEIFRTSDGTNSAAILVTFGAQVTFQAVLLAATNLTPAATWRIRVSTADVTGVAGDAYDSGTASAGVSTEWRRALKIFPSAVTGGFLLVNLTDASLPFLEAGILRALTVWNPSRGYRFGWKRLTRDWSKVPTGPNGQQWPRLGPVQRGVEFGMPAIPDAEWAASADPMARYSGISRDVMACMDAGAADLGREIYYGLLEQPLEYERPTFGAWSTAVRLWDRV